MTTQNFLKQIAQKAFGPEYQEEIRAIYQRDVEAGEFQKEEDDYNAAMDALTGLLSQDKLLLLAEYEKICLKIREFSATFGFKAGLLCGFKQYFTADRACDGGFLHHVADEIKTLPNMQRHPTVYSDSCQRNVIGKQITEGESEDLKEHFVSVECTWGQREYSASIHGFYCGYRAAMSMIDLIMGPGKGSINVIDKLLNMEYHLGYIKPYAEVERLGSSEAVG